MPQARRHVKDANGGTEAVGLGTEEVGLGPGGETASTRLASIRSIIASAIHTAKGAVNALASTRRAATVAPARRSAGQTDSTYGASATDAAVRGDAARGRAPRHPRCWSETIGHRETSHAGRAERLAPVSVG